MLILLLGLCTVQLLLTVLEVHAAATMNAGNDQDYFT
jgi:hypothetical protein